MAARIEMEPIAYRGIVDAQTDAAAGWIEVVVTTLASARSLIDAWRLRVLAVAAEKRDPALPDVPTAREAGLAYVTGVRFGMFGPARLPEPIVKRLNAETNQILQEQGCQEFLSRVTCPGDAPQAGALRRKAAGGANRPAGHR
jgi:tripartite-type tricarboxylate transporter receptor subunit TctC